MTRTFHLALAILCLILAGSTAWWRGQFDKWQNAAVRAAADHEFIDALRVREDANQTLRAMILMQREPLPQETPEPLPSPAGMGI